MRIAAPAVPTTAPPPFSWLAAKHVMPEPVMHIGGPPVDNVAIDEEGTITLVRLIGYSCARFGLSLLLLRSVKLMMMVFLSAASVPWPAWSLVWWGNASVDAILLTMPSLVYVLGMAGAVHIINYYRDAVVEGGQATRQNAIKHAIMPCTLAALTTAIGLMSLCSSNILPDSQVRYLLGDGRHRYARPAVLLPAVRVDHFPAASKKIKDASAEG
ncbi:MAG: hypothetical protein R3C56_35515 [Pirellulaceae bacterium]